MKHWLIMVLLLGGCDKKNHPLPLQASLNPSAPAQTTKHAVIGCMGQSNALGIGMTDEFDPVNGVAIDNKRTGPCYAMAANLVNTLGPIQIYQCAVSGSPMDSWSAYGDNYRGCMEWLRLHITSNDYLAAVIFDQGEAESTGAYGEYPWAEHFTAMVRDLRIHYAHVPVIYVQIGPHTTPEDQVPYWSHIQMEQASVMIPNTQMVSSSCLPVVGQHYTQDGYAELGRRLAQAFKELVLQ